MSLLDLITAIALAIVPRSTEDWKAGDLAICIAVKGMRGDDIDPKEGDMLRVCHVCTADLFLHFEGKPDNRHWIAANFRKVKPDTKSEGEEEWVRQLRRNKQVEPA